MQLGVRVSADEVQSDISELHECAGGEIGPTGLPHADSPQGDKAEALKKLIKPCQTALLTLLLGLHPVILKMWTPPQVLSGSMRRSQRNRRGLSTPSPPWSIGLTVTVTMA